MAEASISIDQDHFSCSICLQLLNDPVTTPCGHSYCMGCVNSYWDQEDQSGSYKCPQCRETFNPRPTLRRNNMLTELVANLQKPNVFDSIPSFLHVSSCEIEDMACDSCIGEKKRAVKSCLTCLASFCDEHVLPHHESAAFKRHKLIEAVADLQKKICAQHNKILDVFCQTDQSVICYECSIGAHKFHATLSVQDAWMEKKKHFGELQMKLQSRLDKRDKTLVELKELIKTFKDSAQGAVEDSEKIFTELILFMESRRSDATSLIRAQEKAELDRAIEYQEQLEQEINKLREKNTRMEQLSKTNNYVHFLQSIQFLRSDLDTEDTFKSDFSHHWWFEHFKKPVSQLKEEIEEFYKEKWEKISKNVNFGQIITGPDPDTREQLLKYACELSLDPNTLNYYLTLLDGKTQVTCSERANSYSDHPERFIYWRQVLCKQKLPLRSYWEVEVSGENGVSIALSYKKIERNGSDIESRFGHNGKSWRLVYYPTKFSFWHNNTQVEISGPTSKRIGVYLDQKKGNVSFYSVSAKVTLIHQVTSTFTESLYLGFGLGIGSRVNICLQAKDSITATADQCLKK